MSLLCSSAPSDIPRSPLSTMLLQGKPDASLPAVVCAAHPVNQWLQIEHIGSFLQSTSAHRPRQVSISVAPSDTRTASTRDVSSSLLAALMSANTACAGALTYCAEQMFGHVSSCKYDISPLADECIWNLSLIDSPKRTVSMQTNQLCSDFEQECPVRISLGTT